MFYNKLLHLKTYCIWHNNQQSLTTMTLRLLYLQVLGWSYDMNIVQYLEHYLQWQTADEPNRLLPVAEPASPEDEWSVFSYTHTHRDTVFPASQLLVSVWQESSRLSLLCRLTPGRSDLTHREWPNQLRWTHPSSLSLTICKMGYRVGLVI